MGMKNKLVRKKEEGEIFFGIYNAFDPQIYVHICLEYS
jgi:hypothetical protein